MPSLSDRSPSTSRPGSKPWERAALTDTPNTPRPPSPERSAAVRQSVSRQTSQTRDSAVAGLTPRPQPRPVPRPIPQKKRGRSRVLAVGLTLGAAGLIGGAAIGAAVWALSPDDSTSSNSSFADGMAPMMTTPADISTTPSAAAPLPAAPVCVESKSSGAVTGSGPGGFGSGPDAIFGFDHAYYVERSGAAARAFTTPDAAVGTAEVLQRDGIDTFPTGTQHCLRITTRGTDEYTVELTHTVPKAQPLTWTQIVRTRTDGDRTLITSIVDITETEN